MVFVTTGSCEPFPRLVAAIDRVAPELDEEVFMQIGKSNYEPCNCRFERFLPSLVDPMSEARVVVSHGGLACLEVLRSGKPLVVVPRQLQYREHFNDHQVVFAEFLAEKYGVAVLLDETLITASFLKAYDHVVSLEANTLARFHRNIGTVFFGDVAEE